MGTSDGLVFLLVTPFSLSRRLSKALCISKSSPRRCGCCPLWLSVCRLAASSVPHHLFGSTFPPTWLPYCPHTLLDLDLFRSSFYPPATFLLLPTNPHPVSTHLLAAPLRIPFEPCVFVFFIAIPPLDTLVPPMFCPLTLSLSRHAVEHARDSVPSSVGLSPATLPQPAATLFVLGLC